MNRSYLWLLGLLWTLATLADDSIPAVTPAMAATATQLIELALKDDGGYEIVESLTTEVGPRLAGGRWTS